MSTSTEKRCTVIGCEQGVLDEVDINTPEGHHTTQVVWCPVCQPDQYVEFYYKDDMLDLIDDLSKSYDHDKSSHELSSTLYDLRCRAIRLLAKINGDEL